MVLGRDRSNTLVSGAGGKGLTRCGMIDLVVGRMSSYINRTGELLTKKEAVDPNFATDAARIYISQKSLSVDKYFAIPESPLGPKSEQKSAVAVKADHVRIISREKLVLYCGKGNFDGFSKVDGELNSLGNPITLPPRIELLTGKTKDLEPIVKGRQLLEYLKKSNKSFDSLNNLVFSLCTQMAAVNAVLTVLSFGAPPFSKHLIDDITMAIDSTTIGINELTKEIDHLDKLLLKGSNTILSESVYAS